MAAADIHNTDLKVGQYVEIVSGVNFMKRGRITAVGSSVVTVDGVGSNIAQNLCRLLPHGELSPTTSYDWASQQ